MTTDIAAIREALDMGPTPGPWRPRRDPDHSVEWEAVIDIGDGALVVAATFGGTGLEGNEENAKANAVYIAACSPDRITRLLAALETAQADAARYQYVRDESNPYGLYVVGQALDADADRAIAADSTLRKQL